MQMRLDDHVLRLAKSAPSAGQRLAVYSSVIREGKASAGLAAARTSAQGGIPIRKAKIQLPEAAFNIRFVPSQDPRTGASADLPAGVSRQDVEALRRIEPDLLRWIAAKKENAARFFADHVGSLDLAGVKIARSLRLRVLASRKRTASLQAKLPPVRIRSIKVDA